jgi:SAM-dependent methyltransferase
MKTEINKQISIDFSIKMKIIREFGYDLSHESLIMDFGCGSGKMVNELRKMGYLAFGCGTRFSTEENVDTETMMEQGILRSIDLKHYRLPFEDNTFDFIYSNSVFEHVQNYLESIAEIARVLKSDGFCIHSFPSRYLPIECHVRLPFASVIQSRFWLYFWALLGLRNEDTEFNNAKVATEWFYNYLKTETNYLTKTLLKKHFKMYFNDVIFCEKYRLKHSPGKGKYLYSLSILLPFIPALYSTFRQRTLFARFPGKVLQSTV